MKKIFSLLVVISCLFAVNWSAKALTYTVTVPDGTSKCYIAGSMNNWSPTANPMNKVDGANQFTIDLPNAKETDEYKYCCGPDWQYVEKDAAGAEIANRTWKAADVVATWMNLFVPVQRTVTIEVWAPMEITVLYITGSFNNWSPDSNEMTYLDEEDGGKVFETSIESEDADNIQFKFLAGPGWTYEPKDGTNLVYGDLPGAETDHVSLTVAVADFKAVYDPTKIGDITITATVPVGTERVWVMGDFPPLASWNWGTDPGSADPDALEMTKQDDGTFTYTFRDVQAVTYRLYCWPDWQYMELDETNPDSWDLPSRTASFPDDANINISVWQWRTEAPTAMPQIANDNFKAYSLNGQIVVEGATSQVDIFAVTGQLVQSAKVSGSFTSKDLNTGLYIVRVDGVSQKVMVK